MTITAQVIADSISPAGIRLTTFQLRYPRFIHAELMTHRVFSRNASSSRAIPVERMIADLRRDPAMPVYWGGAQKGMQAGAELEEFDIRACKTNWLQGMEHAIATAEKLMQLGLHKQIANRVLEPWAHINVVVTATDYANFYALRRHPDAQPEIKALADAMWDAQQASEPKLLRPGEWHLPYITEYDRTVADEISRRGTDHTSNPHTTDGIYDQILLKSSVARCARVSYMTHEGKPTTFEADAELYDRLVGPHPLHASPAEHQATPDEKTAIFKDDKKIKSRWNQPRLHGNFRGWIQLRKTLPGEFTPG